MNAQDEFQLAVWQQVRHLPPEERIKQIDDQIRMDALLRDFYRADREQELKAEFKRQMSCVLVEFPCVITGSQSPLPSSALSSSGV